jgi:hypothetical protein
MNADEQGSASNALVKAGVFRNRAEAVEEALHLLFAGRPQLNVEAAIQLYLETLVFSVILQMIEDGSVALRQPSLWNSKQRGVGDDSTCSRRSRGIA